MTDATSTCSTSSIPSATRAAGIRTTCGRGCGPRSRSRTSRPTGYEPFWAITKHADILEISKQPLRFSSAQGITLRPAGVVFPPSEMVVMLDPPRHGPVRRVANGRFTPRAVREQRRRHRAHRGRDPRRRRVGPDASGELDFVERIAAPFPLGVIAWILGVPSDDWELLFRWTNEVIGKDDPEYRRPGETPGQDEQAGARRAARLLPAS